MLPSSVDEFDKLGIGAMESGQGYTYENLIFGMSEILYSGEEDVKSEKLVQMWMAIGKLFQREWVSDHHDLYSVDFWRTFLL